MTYSRISFLDPGAVSLDPDNAVVGEGDGRIAQEFQRLQDVVGDDGLHHVKFEMALEPAKPVAASLPMMWAQTMVMASTWVG